MALNPTPPVSGPIVILAAAIVGTGLSLYYYLTPLTGITGEPGTLLVLAASVALVLDGLILWFGPRGAVFNVFWALGLLGVTGTLAAAWFLHAWWLMAAMAVVVVGLLASLLPFRNT